MNVFKRGVLSVSAAVMMFATGCDGGREVIPLADVPPPKENPNQKKPPKAPPGVPTSPTELIYK